MAKSEKAVYAPGELDRIRNKLGVNDHNEAKRMAALLGGEVGVEREEEAAAKARRAPLKKDAAGPVSSGGGGGGGGGGSKRRPGRHVELAAEEEEAETLRKTAIRRASDPADDPLIPVKASYFERIKIDRFCALPEFKIKSVGQAFLVIFSFFGEPPDLVNPAFITKKLNGYYKKVEQLVTSVRALLPRNNMKRNEKLKRVGPATYALLEVLRYWDLEKIAGDIAKVQAHPRNVKISELSDILKAIYRPLFILEQMETDVHVKGAFKLLYKILYLENPMDAKEKYQGLIRDALTAFNDVRRDLHYYLYPLLMKLLSDRYLSYETFFHSRRNRFMDFIGATEDNQMKPAAMAPELSGGRDIAIDDDTDDEAEKEGEGQDKENDKPEEEDPNDPEVIARKEKEAAQVKEHKAMLQGVASLEALFPKAGWERLSAFPDMYPYFRAIFNLQKGYDLIAPTDPLLQVVVIMRVLEDLFLGIRDIHFGTILNNESGPVAVDEAITTIISNWHSYIDFPLEKEYLPRLSEYCRILEQSAESRTSNYAKRLLCELHWIKRLFFFPYYKFDMLFPPPLQKKDIEPEYPAIRALRRNLTRVAAGIEQANKIGGADKMVPCDGIDNPWETYSFAIDN
ncbi:MAG: hypothetical protein LBT39_07325, partial [Treponema sp.]|nr:hypothetical protein [Treponema sp.]